MSSRVSPKEVVNINKSRRMSTYTGTRGPPWSVDSLHDGFLVWVCDDETCVVCVQKGRRSRTKFFGRCKSFG